MDPKANLDEQLALAKRVQEIAGSQPAYIELNEELSAEVRESASRLSELVLALHEWREKGGFDPYQTAPTMDLEARNPWGIYLTNIDTELGYQRLTDEQVRNLRTEHPRAEIFHMKTKDLYVLEPDDWKDMGFKENPLPKRALP
jgi:hypothetical protein